jgi:hypothetical protein
VPRAFVARRVSKKTKKRPGWTIATRAVLAQRKGSSRGRTSWPVGCGHGKCVRPSYRTRLVSARFFRMRSRERR